MKTIFFTANMQIVDEWHKRHSIENFSSCFDIESLESTLAKEDDALVIADYDSVASDINKLISSNTVPKYMIVLERAPEIVTGKMLLSYGIKAYGNSRMSNANFLQMLSAVTNEKVWTYPQLTVALAENVSKNNLSHDSITMIKNRLTDKEESVLYLVLNGLTNDAIAQKINVTPRTVKAHMSSIFHKLHVNDRLSLVLLLK